MRTPWPGEQQQAARLPSRTASCLMQGLTKDAGMHVPCLQVAVPLSPLPTAMCQFLPHPPFSDACLLCLLGAGGCGARLPAAHVVDRARAPRVFTLCLDWGAPLQQPADIAATLAAVDERVRGWLREPPAGQLFCS